MAFGFGFKKQKVLNSAEKFVQQGKLQNAITEYEKILKADPKDLTVLNTVGDLYSRLGQGDRAVECFKNVGDAYAAQGFTVKAIAMYKKLSKLKPSLDCVLRLAELYTQQGLFNDARTQYKQVAEEFLRVGEMEQAVRIFQKILEMDPDNAAMRTKLAEVYVRMGKKAEAWQIFSAAVESLRARGASGPAEEIVQRMLTLDPGNSQALLLRGLMAYESGDSVAAIECLNKVADLDSHPAGLRALLQAYLHTGHLAEAGTLASKLLSVHNDVDAITRYAEALISANRFEDALQIYEQYSDRLLASDADKILDNLHALISPLRENIPALETLVQLLSRAGENTHLTELYELLAHATVQSGELEKARDYYLKLAQLEPQNALHMRNYQQVINRLGDSVSASLITVEEGTTLVDELEATAPFIDQRYADDVALAIRASLTDAELFVSYNMPAKALGPLQATLPKAPRDSRLNQRLAALYTRAGRFEEAGSCCRTLESLYHDAGYPDEATRYGELAAKYEERATAGSVKSSEIPLEILTAPESALDAMPLPAVDSTLVPEAIAFAPASPATPAAPATPRKAAGLFWHAPPVAAEATPSLSDVAAMPPAVQASEPEIDISAEWEDTISVDTSSLSTEPIETFASVPGDSRPAAASVGHAQTIADTVSEIRFYLKHLMEDQARAGLDKLRQLKPDISVISAIEAEIAAVTVSSPSAESEEVAIEEVSEISVVEDATPVDGISSSFSTPPAVAPWPEPQPVAAASTNVLGNFVSDLESSLGDSFLPTTATSTSGAGKKIAAPAQSPAHAGRDLGIVARPGVPLAASSPVSAAAAPALAQSPAPPSAESAPTPPIELGVDLSDIFGELKQELEAEVPTAGEDCETHYNLGVAFREMGLLDEAIGELQKVCQAIDRGHTFPQVMQTYTWLAQCFLDKGVPEAAIRWYEKALQVPKLDGETRTALHYELASAHEFAHNKPEALKHFLEVYGSNIDYRDVNERIKALKS